MISENFYVRGDGTRAFYFSNVFLTSLFNDNGFDVEELGLCCKQVENRSRELVMNRRWVQAVFRVSNSSFIKEAKHEDLLGLGYTMAKEKDCSKELSDNSEVDISEGLGAEMFGVSPCNNSEVIEIKLGDHNFKISVLSKEYQHIYKSTGLMLWESARMMASVLARNPSIVEGKKVLELGCGCGGLCSMVATRSADLVVATDGDTLALKMLTQNVASNLRPPFLDRLLTKRLEWGYREHIDSIREVNSEGFDVILGTDVTYIPEAVVPLFATASELISSNKNGKKDEEAALILCHVVRRVDEQSMLSAASRFGFRLVDKWPVEPPSNPSRSVGINISSWFPVSGSNEYIPSTALNIMYFCM